MKPQTVLLVIFVIVSLITKNCQAGYGKINDYLIKQVSENDEIAPNMEAASKWLKELEANRFASILAPVSNLRKFVALKRVIDDNKCDGEAYEIMRINEEALGFSKLDDSDEKYFRRVDKVIKKIFKDHAERCDKVYPVTLRDLQQRLDARKVESVAKLARSIMYYDKRLLLRPERDLTYYHIRNPVSIIRYIGNGSLKAALMASANEDPDLKYLHATSDERTGKVAINKNKINELAQKHLFEPCKYFTNSLGPNVFIPALFGLRFFKHSVDVNNFDYYLTWARFRICKLLIEQEVAVLYDVTDSVAKGTPLPTR